MTTARCCITPRTIQFTHMIVTMNAIYMANVVTDATTLHIFFSNSDDISQYRSLMALYIILVDAAMSAIAAHRVKMMMAACLAVVLA